MTRRKRDEPDPDQLRGTRTEYVTREYDSDGKLTREVRTTTIEATPDKDAQPELGGYL